MADAELIVDGAAESSASLFIGDGTFRVQVNSKEEALVEWF